MSKFINLSEDIAIATENTRSPYAWDAQREALEWLDSHPDQVPGRTITESGVTEVFEASKSGRGGTRTALVRQGVTVVPDPKPTNAEKLAASIDMSSRGLIYLTEHQIAQLVKGLEEDGVKAPDHD